MLKLCIKTGQFRLTTGKKFDHRSLTPKIQYFINYLLFNIFLILMTKILDSTSINDLQIILTNVVIIAFINHRSASMVVLVTHHHKQERTNKNSHALVIIITLTKFVLKLIKYQ
jgi:hypothetical protein